MLEKLMLKFERIIVLIGDIYLRNFVNEFIDE